jgi:hypothetical protein
MKALLNPLSRSATEMIRADHTRVLAFFHRYDIDARPAAKRALVESICLALEIHAQLEEEIFYPALRAAGSTLVEKGFPEHEEMRSLIQALRNGDAALPEYDATFMDLMRAVMHHMADEETALLPHAETRLRDRLGELGARMVKRRLQLSAPRVPQLARHAVARAPGNAAIMAAGAIVAGLFVAKRLRRPHL